MKNKLARIACALVLAAAMLVPVPLAFGDAGSFSGNSDYSFSSGGSGSSSGGSSSSGSSSSGSNFIFIPGSSSSSYDDDSEDSPVVVVLTLAVLAAILVVPYIRANKKKPASSDGTANLVDEFDSSKLRPLFELTDAEAPGFNADAMEEHIAGLYPRLQNAWTAKDLEPVRPLFSEKLYAQLDRQLDELRRAHRTNKVEDVSVMDVQLSGWYEEGGNVSVVAIVQTRIKDYTVDDRTGALVSGSKTAEKFMKYRYTLTQPKGAAPADQTQTNCPNCGAPIDVNKSAECPYCGTMIKSAAYTWVVSSIQGLEQRTA